MNHQIETPIRSPSQARFRSREERIQIGKSLRERLPRSRHAIWQPPAAGREPIEIIEASNQGRLQELIPIRYGRMLRSPFTFLRGSAALMAYDLATTPKTDIIVQACGDCHLLNFGFFATPERNLVFDINDFDETLPAPWEWDLKRLVVSFVIAGRDSDLSDRESKAAAIDCARSYREHLREYSRLSPLEVWYTRIGVEQVLEMAPDEKTRKIREQMMTKARERIIEHLYPKIVTQSGGRNRFVDQPPILYHVNEPDWETLVREGLEDYRQSLPEERRVLFDRYQLEDFALKVVGIGSVGTRCYIALLFSEDNHPLILQVKEACPSVLEPYTAKSQYEGVSAVQLQRYAEFCGWTLARAHAKSGDAATISGYLGKGDQFDLAMGEFAIAYAEQTEQDHAALVEAVKTGRVEALVEENL